MLSLARCVNDDDISSLIKLPGIGKKTAERLLIELRDKVKELMPSSSNMPLLDGEPGDAPVADIEKEAEEALVALGYKPQDAAKAIKSAKHEGQTLESLIKSALKGMF